MALKKIKPLSPDIYLGHTIGDNEVARLGHVNDIVSKFRKTCIFPVPALNDIITIRPNHVETIIVFEGLILNDFTINIVIDPRYSPNLEPGDRMYIFLEGPGNSTVTFTGPIEVTQCGGSHTQYSPGDPVCLEVIYNGNKFIGIDIC